MSLSTATPAAGLYHLRLERHPPPSPSANIVVLQDFLASAPVPQPPTPPPPPLPLPLPPTALSLSSTLEFTYLSAGAGPPSNSSSGDDSRGDFMPDSFAGAHADIFSFAARKHGAAADPPRCPGAGGGDRRHRRMIKNRESAARSRARKQAYTNELELALAQLRRENEMLIKRQEELNVRQRLAMAAQVPDRPSVQRCRSAPP